MFDFLKFFISAIVILVSVILGSVCIVAFLVIWSSLVLCLLIAIGIQWCGRQIKNFVKEIIKLPEGLTD